nr:translation initiation factor IF-2-like [Pongo abelii]
MEELSQMPPQHGPPTGHEGPRAGTGLKGQQPLGLPAFHPNSVFFRNVFFIHDPGARPSCTPGPRRAAFPTPEHVDGRGPRAAGGGAAGAPPPGLRPDPRPAATWREGPRWPPRDPNPGRTQRPRQPEQPKLGEGGAPAGAGEGRAGPTNVSDLGSGRPPLPRRAATARGVPHRNPGKRRGSPACGQERPSGTTGLEKVCERPSAPRPRAEETRSRPQVRPTTATRESRGSVPPKNPSGNNRRPEREQEGRLLWKQQMSPVPPTSPKITEEKSQRMPTTS